MASHVAIQITAYLQRELAHVEIAEGEAAVGQLIIHIVGIKNVCRFFPVDGTTAPTVSLDIEVSQLMHIVLHRERRERIDEHIGIDVGHVVLVIVIGLRGHGVEHVALDEVVGIGFFIVHLLVFARCHVLLDGVGSRISLHVQIAQPVEGRNLKQKASVLRPLRGAGSLGAA